MKYYVRTKEVEEDIKQVKGLPSIVIDKLVESLKADISHKKSYLEIEISGMGLTVRDIEISDVPVEFRKQPNKKLFVL